MSHDTDYHDFPCLTFGVHITIYKGSRETIAAPTFEWFEKDIKPQCDIAVAASLRQAV